MHLRLQILKFILLLLTVECIAADILRVDNIYVSEKTGDQIDSKSIAIINGTKIALKKIISNLNASNHKQVQNVQCIDDMQTPEKLLQNQVIHSERVTAQSYSAYIDFIFNKQDVESLMNKCGFQYGSVSPGKTLLVPLINTGDQYRIIDQEMDKDLLSTINALPKQVGILNIETVYNEDISTIGNLDLNILMNGSYKEILDILKKYNRKSLLLIGLDNFCKDQVSLNLRFISENEEYKDSQIYVAEPGENQALLLKRAYNTSLKQMDLNWKKGFVGVENKIYNSGVLVELSDPSQWNKLNNILRSIDSIKQYKFKSIGHDSVEIDMKYTVTPQELSQILSGYNIAIFKRGDQTLMKFIK